MCTRIGIGAPLQSRFEHVNRWKCPSMPSAGPFSPWKLPLCVWGSGPHLIRGSLDPCTLVPNSITIGSVAFAELTVIADRPLYSVCNHRCRSHGGPGVRTPTKIWLWDSPMARTPHKDFTEINLISSRSLAGFVSL